MTEKTILLNIERQTPGAVRYIEVDANGQVVPQAQAVLKNIYIRKTAIDGVVPQFLEVVIRQRALSNA